LDFYLFLCEYMSGNKAVAYSNLERILNAKPHLVSSSGFLSDVMNDSQVQHIIAKYYTDGEIDELHSVIHRETTVSERFFAQANKLKDYYQQKANSTMGR